MTCQKSIVWAFLTATGSTMLPQSQKGRFPKGGRDCFREHPAGGGCEPGFRPWRFFCGPQGRFMGNKINSQGPVLSRWGRRFGGMDRNALRRGNRGSCHNDVGTGLGPQCMRANGSVQSRADYFFPNRSTFPSGNITGDRIVDLIFNKKGSFPDPPPIATIRRRRKTSFIGSMDRGFD